MKYAEFFSKYRNYTSIPFFIIAIILSEPRQDLFNFGALLVLFGLLMRIWGLSYLPGGTQQTVVEQRKLVTNGPYAFIRNPVYFGNIFMNIGMIIAIGGWLPYLLWIGLFFFPIFYQLIAKYEEKQLVAEFGTAFNRYRQAVPRFYMRISPYPDRTKINPDLNAALAGEKNTFIVIAVYAVIFAVRWYLLAY